LKEISKTSTKQCLFRFIVFVFNYLDLASTLSLSFVLQGELNKMSSETVPVENGNQTDGKEAIDKTGTANAKHHLLLLQVNSRPGIS